MSLDLRSGLQSSKAPASYCHKVVVNLLVFLEYIHSQYSSKQYYLFLYLSLLSLFLFYDASSDSPSEAQIQNFQNLRHYRSSPHRPIAPIHHTSHPTSSSIVGQVRSGQEPTNNKDSFLEQIFFIIPPRNKLRNLPHQCNDERQEFHN